MEIGCAVTLKKVIYSGISSLLEVFLMKFLLTAVILVSAFSPLAFSADAQKGQILYQKCIQCHGDNGEGKKSQQAPQIAGQFDWYIVKSLNDFKSGARKNPTQEAV